MVIRKGSISPPGQQIQILSADILKGLLGIPVQRREDFFFKYFSAASKVSMALRLGAAKVYQKRNTPSDIR